MSVTQDLHISLERGRERGAMSIGETVKTQKWYYVHNMRSAYFPFDRRLCVCRERERLLPSVKWSTWKWYFVPNTRSAYFPREREVMSICEMVHQDSTV